MQHLLAELEQVETLANGSKIDRLRANPFNYIFAAFHRIFLYPITKKGVLREITTFFKQKMYVLLPAATDLYLLGGKSHSSELRLAKFILNELKTSDVFIDIGAHFGYFTLLAATIVGKNGKVMSFEAAKNTFALLEKNTAAISQIQIFHRAISNKSENLTFFEFPVLYSEYNSSYIEQFENEAWIQKFKPEKVTIAAISLDEALSTLNRHPNLIKIDVEGAEDKVFEGARQFLTTNKTCQIVMEYLNPTRHNDAHQKAKTLIETFGYQCHIINQQGKLLPMNDVDTYLLTQNLDSDNVVFKK